MFVVARTFALHLSSASMRSYLKKSNRPHKPLVLWTVQMLDQLSIVLTHPLIKEKTPSSSPTIGSPRSPQTSSSRPLSYLTIA
jgi:hypothetical protein